MLSDAENGLGDAVRADPRPFFNTALRGFVSILGLESRHVKHKNRAHLQTFPIYLGTTAGFCAWANWPSKYPAMLRAKFDVVNWSRRSAS